MTGDDLTNGPVLEERLDHARRQVRLALLIIAGFFILSFIAGALLLLPYKPMHVHSYHATTTEVCSQQIVVVVVDYAIARSPSGEGVKRIEAVPLWIVEDVRGISKGEVLELNETIWAPDLLEPGRRTTRSTVQRLAPAMPGEWRPAVDLTVRGRGLLGVPGVQQIHRQAKEVITVLEPTHPACTEGSP